MSIIMLAIQLRDDHADRLIRDMELGERAVSAEVAHLRVRGLTTEAMALESLVVSMNEDITSFKLLREVARNEWRARKEAGSVPQEENELGTLKPEPSEQRLFTRQGDKQYKVAEAVKPDTNPCETCRGRGYFERAIPPRDAGHSKPTLKEKMVCIKCKGEGFVLV